MAVFFVRKSPTKYLASAYNSISFVLPVNERLSIYQQLNFLQKPMKTKFWIGNYFRGVTQLNYYVSECFLLRSNNLGAEGDGDKLIIIQPV